MAGLNVDDVIEVKILGKVFNQQIVTTFAYRITNASVNANTIDACASFAGQWKAGAVSPFLAFLACCSPEYNADQVTCQKIAPTRWRPGVNDVNLPGTNANPTTSPNQSAVITRGGAMSGRKNIGNIHIPAVSQANLLDGEVTAGYLALMQTCATRMLNVFYDTVDGGTQAFPVMINRVWNPVTEKYVYGGTTDLYFTRPQTTARVMRRRTNGVGK